jgi:diguanylate cyclase (GGDEF)-like protein
MIHAYMDTEGPVNKRRQRRGEEDGVCVNTEDQPTGALLALREMGWLEAGGARIFVCEAAGGFYTLREQIAREIGREAQADIFYRAGFAATERLVRHALAHGYAAPNDDGFRRAIGLLTAGGYGAFTVSETHFENFWAVIDVHNSMESDVVRTESGSSGFVCDYTRGLLRGLMFHLQVGRGEEQPVECAEISCTANEDLSCRFVIGTEDEIAARGYRVGNAEFTSVRETLLRLNRQLENVLEAAQRDSLTGLYNRAYFEDALRRRIEFANRRTDALSVAIIDVDHFKEVNDTRGHGMGDIALQQIARLIGSQGRETDVVARYGGDEFAMLMPGTPAEAAVKVADRIRHLVETAQISDIPLSLSIGIAACPTDATALTELLDLADEAMYEVKERGGNGVRRYLSHEPHVAHEITMEASTPPESDPPPEPTLEPPKRPIPVAPRRRILRGQPAKRRHRPEG